MRKNPGCLCVHNNILDHPLFADRVLKRGSITGPCLKCIVFFYDPALLSIKSDIESAHDSDSE